MLLSFDGDHLFKFAPLERKSQKVLSTIEEQDQIFAIQSQRKNLRRGAE